MSLDELSLGAPEGDGGVTSLHLLVKDASRQLSICNSCRYCEGLCAVFPALERRTQLELSDISQLANLCHDCRACYDGCMYTPPHPFAINVPEVLSRVRLVDYRAHTWPARVPRMFSGWTGVFSGGVLITLVLFAIATAHAGVRELLHAPDVPQAPYQLIPYGLLLVLILLPAVYAVAVMALAGRSYWRQIGGAPEGVSARDVRRAIRNAVTLRYLRGGGNECYYPESETPSAGRRRLHTVMVGGLALCLVSTCSAAVLQDFLGSDPPYPWLSAPVITGTVGGVGIVVGCLGLLMLKARSSGDSSVRDMTIKDYGLLVALTFLALSGLATLLTRSTAAFGAVFLVHLAAILLTFALAPYSKLVHVVFRFLALVRDETEQIHPATSAKSRS
jgi:citrate/tricarballylate utilization protein